jgi:hypothetical protein
MLEWTYQSHGMPWRINGVEYRIDPHQRHRLGREYDPSVGAFLRERMQSGWTCFDVGANVGVYVLQLAYWSGPSVQVVVFEPNAAARAILSRHVEWNGIAGRVTTVAAAVGSECGLATLYAAEADGMSRLNLPNSEIAHQAQPVIL